VGSDTGKTTNCVGIPNNTAYFYDPLNPPMPAWDFLTIWTANAGAYPTLR